MSTSDRRACEKRLCGSRLRVISAAVIPWGTLALLDGPPLHGGGGWGAAARIFPERWVCGNAHGAERRHPRGNRRAIFRRVSSGGRSSVSGGAWPAHRAEGVMRACKCGPAVGPVGRGAAVVAAPVRHGAPSPDAAPGPLRPVACVPQQQAPPGRHAGLHVVRPCVFSSNGTWSGDG